MTKFIAYWVVIPAAGEGQRFGGVLPKQYIKLHNKTILEHTIAKFMDLQWVKQIIVPLAKDDPYFYQLPCQNEKKLKSVVGGASRMDSVLNALESLSSVAEERDWILVHDAARPAVHQQDIVRLKDTLSEDMVGGILATFVQDTLKKVQDNVIQHTVSRANLVQALTPQMFRYGQLKTALLKCKQSGYLVTDEAGAMEYAAHQPKIILAQYPNPKLTYQNEIDLLAWLLKAPQKSAQEKG